MPVAPAVGRAVGSVILAARGSKQLGPGVAVCRLLQLHRDA